MHKLLNVTCIIIIIHAIITMHTFSRHEDSIFANSQVMESDGDSDSFIKVWFNTT